MKRKLFFYFEKLEIDRRERIAVSSLLVLAVLLSGFLLIHEPKANYSEAEYAELEKIFKEKSKKNEQEEKILLARYQPDEDIRTTTSVTTKQHEYAVQRDTTAGEDASDKRDDYININIASNNQLQELPGVGPAYAERIINWRNEHGRFTSKDQLLEINGIGEKRLARLKPLVSL